MPDEDAPLVGQSNSNEARLDAAQALRRFLAAIETGELEANSARAKALIRRLEGAVVGLEVDEGNAEEPEP